MAVLPRGVHPPSPTAPAWLHPSSLCCPPQELYLEARDADERERLLLSLGYAAGGSNVQATLQFSLSPDVRAQVRPGVAARWQGQGCPRAQGGEAGSQAAAVPHVQHARMSPP